MKPNEIRYFTKSNSRADIRPHMLCIVRYVLCWSILFRRDSSVHTRQALFTCTPNTQNSILSIFSWFFRLIEPILLFDPISCWAFFFRWPIFLHSIDKTSSNKKHFPFTTPPQNKVSTIFSSWLALHSIRNRISFQADPNSRRSIAISLYSAGLLLMFLISSTELNVTLLGYCYRFIFVSLGAWLGEFFEWANKWYIFTWLL